MLLDLTNFILLLGMIKIITMNPNYSNPSKE